MCHLVTDGSVNVQRMAYQLLHEAAKKYTEHLVIEAAVDVEGTMKIELPIELLDILQRNLNQEDFDEFGQVMRSWNSFNCLAHRCTGVVWLPAWLDGCSGSVHGCGTSECIRQIMDTPLTCTLDSP